MEDFLKVQLFNSGILMGKHEFDYFHKEVVKELNSKIQSVCSSVYVSTNPIKEGENEGKFEISFYQTGANFITYI